MKPHTPCPGCDTPIKRIYNYCGKCGAHVEHVPDRDEEKRVAVKSALDRFELAFPIEDRTFTQHMHFLAMYDDILRILK